MQKNLWYLALTAILVAVISAGCAAPGAEAAGQGLNQQRLVAVDDQATEPGGAEPTPIGHVVDTGSGGTGQEQRSAPNVVNSEGGDQSTTTEVNTANWVAYVNKDYHFTLNVPYGSVAKAADVQIEPAPEAQFEIADPSVAGTDAAEFAPPALSIRVYKNADGTALSAWLEGSGILARFGGSKAKVEPFKVKGADGMRVVSIRMMAPNWSAFVSGGDLIYELTPLGPIGEQMLASFQPTS